MFGLYPIEDAQSSFAQRGISIFKTGSADWVTWRKPQRGSMLYIMCVGGGGGGGAGHQAALGNNRGGGGGGGSAAFTQIIVPMTFLPDVLYIQPGIGGTPGVVGGANGGTGALSYVCLAPSTTYTADILARSGNATAGGGTTASSGTGGAAGSAGSVSSQSQSFWPAFVLPLWLAGRAGGAGATNGAAGSATLSATAFWNSGSGGGGCNSSNSSHAGGNVPTIGGFPSRDGGASGGGAGTPGDIYFFPHFSCFGGAGGGSNGTGTGGAGGDGGPGCGGGGGGAGVTGGAGGRGGDGLVILQVFG